MVHIDDIIPEHELLAAIDSGLVRDQQHPELPYTILNYTKAAQAERIWNRATLNARGLIFNHHTGEVIARPFKKFFNHDELKSESWRRLSDEPVAVTDKLDGSLGILYPDGYRSYAIATRGSFTSEQALEGTRIFQEKYADSFEPVPGFTYLFEIIYPENRIVVDYGQTRDLVLIGLRQNEIGFTLSPFPETARYYGWDGPVAKVFPYSSAYKAVTAAPRKGKEGLVIHFLNSGNRVKVKQNDYKELHRIVTGLNQKVVWEHMKSDGSIAGLTAKLPEEHSEWVEDVAARLMDQYFSALVEVQGRFSALEEADLLGDRRGYALAIKDFEPWLKAALFAVLDGKSVDEIIWKQIEPKGEK